MGAAAFVARLQIRRRWRSLAVIALVLALAGGVAISLIAGSRRSASVVHRYLGTTIPYDFQLAGTLTRAQARRLPGVARADPDLYFASSVVHPDGSLGDHINGMVFDRAGVDPTFRIISGRVPDETDATGVMVNERFARQYGVRAGDPLTVKTWSERDRADVDAARYNTPHGPQYQFRVAAVVRTPLDIVTDQVRTVGPSAYGDPSTLYVPSAFYDKHHTEFLGFGESYEVELEPGTRPADFEAAMQRDISRGTSVQFIGPARFAERAGSFDTPVGIETMALLGLGAATAVVGAIVVALLLRAEQRVHAQDADLIRALGSTRRQLGAAAVLRTAPFAAFGAVLALVIAIALSARFPIGIGRMLELHQGVSVNLAVVAIGLLAIFLLTIAVSFAFGRRVTNIGHAPAPRRTTVDRFLARNGAPPEVVVGSHMAFGRGDAGRSVPNRPAIVAGALALAVVVATSVFLAGSGHLYADSSAHGWPWDVMIGNVNFPISRARDAKITADPRLSAATNAHYGQATVGNISTEVLAYDPAGTAPPTMLSGRLPRAADEIAPGAELLHKLHAHVGDTVPLSVAGGDFESEDRAAKPLPLRIVGESIAPVLGESELGDVAVVPLAAIRAAGGVAGPQLILARLRGDDHGTAIRGLIRDYTPDVLVDSIPARVVNLHRVRALPVVGAALAALLGTVLLAYTLAVGARIRVRQLGILRALGMTSRRVGRVLAWQGVALAIAFIVLGLPIGLVLGSVVWRAVADSLGVAPHPTIAWWIVLLVPAAIAVSLAASLVPARRARRAQVADLLHSE
jgi:hypothetical protein